jgi:hypothetical protein
MRRWCAVFAALLLVACSVIAPVNDRAAFDRWMAIDPVRSVSFERFETMLVSEGVANVIPSYELWLTDQINQECVVEPFTAPPEEVWPRIVPTLRFIRDQIEPAIGDVRVVSAYRDEAFNTCVRGAPRSAHREYYALDLVPVDRTFSRAILIQTLCPIHDDHGAAAQIGLGIYAGQRFHIDARGFRGWGADYHRATFPCDRQAA